MGLLKKSLILFFRHSKDKYADKKREYTGRDDVITADRWYPACSGVDASGTGESGVSPANHTEGSDAVETVGQAIKQTGINPVTVCADSAYAGGENSAAFETRGIRFVSPPRLPRTFTVK